MTKDMKKFLRRMINNDGFIAHGIYNDNLHYWHNIGNHSSSPVNIILFKQLKQNGYIAQDALGRYIPTKLGIKFALPWYKRIFNNG